MLTRTTAWRLLVAALALHVIDEAATGFLDFYNPLVLSVRARAAWFPMPTFTFGPWLAGLTVLVIVLAWLSRYAESGHPAMRVLTWVFVAVMLANGIGHLVGSLYFGRWLPGTTSAPLLLAACWLLAMKAVDERRR